MKLIIEWAFEGKEAVKEAANEVGGEFLDASTLSKGFSLAKDTTTWEIETCSEDEQLELIQDIENYCDNEGLDFHSIYIED